MAENRSTTLRFIKPLLAVLLVVFAALSVAYNYYLPLFEAPDEGAHYIYVDTIARTRALPDLNRQASHEVSQPPLYYIIGAPLIAWIDRSDFWDVYRPDPSLQNGIVYDHLPRERDIPPTGVVLALRVLRLYSAVLGALTALMVYAAVRNLSGRDDVALLAFTLTAFDPKFIHMSSQFNNDIAVIFAGALCLWVASGMMARDRLPSRKQALALGAAAGIAAATKYSGLAMAAVAAYAIIWCVWRVAGVRSLRRSLASLLKLGTTAAAGYAATGGILFLYNTMRYGDPLTTAQVDLSNGSGLRPVPLSLKEIIDRLPFIIKSFWGDFGHGIQFPPAVDTVIYAVAAVAIIGLVVLLARRRIPPAMSLLAVSFGVTAAAYLVWLRSQVATENARLLGPAFTVVTMAYAIGLMAWVPRRYGTVFSLLVVPIGIAGAVVGLNLSLIRGYPFPDYLSDSASAALPAQGAVHFDNGMELVSASVSRSRLAYGDTVNVSVYWRATRPITDVYRVIVDLRDASEISLGSMNELPLNGRYATTQLAPGRIFEDNYQVTVTSTHTVSAPEELVRVLVGWFQHKPPYRVSRVLENGAANAQIDVIKVEGIRPPEVVPAVRLSSAFGNILKLEGYQITGDRLILFWRGISIAPRNYTVFVHFIDGNSKMVGQADAPFNYPLTLLDSGQQLVDTHTIAMPASAVRLEVGVYDPATGERLRAVRADGTAWQDNAVLIALK